MAAGAAAAAIRDHPATTAEIRELCGDLQVLGRSEFKALLKWCAAPSQGAVIVAWMHDTCQWRGPEAIGLFNPSIGSGQCSSRWGSSSSFSTARLRKPTIGMRTGASQLLLVLSGRRDRMRRMQALAGAQGPACESGGTCA